MNLDSIWFDLDGKPIDMFEWGKIRETRDAEVSWIVGKTQMSDDVEVSTVWIGIDMNFGDGPPLIFETMVFGGEYDQRMRRYTTREEAYAGHEEIVALLEETGLSVVSNDE